MIETRISQLSQTKKDLLNLLLAKEGLHRDSATRRVEKFLVAYLVGAQGQQPIEADAMRRFLRRKLPEYMVPALFMPLTQLPMTPNGKVNRRALPKPKRFPSPQTAAPQGSLEQLLAQIWTSSLGVDKVGRHDNFFDLGGHSILATRIIARLREALKQDLPLRSLFENPTVADLARFLEVADNYQSHGGPVPLSDEERNLPPLSFAQERLWFLNELTGANAVYNIFGALNMVGFLSVPALEAAFHMVMARHETLRSNVITQEGKAVLRITPEPKFNLIAEQLDSSENSLTTRLVAEAEQPFDLAHDPLIRIRLLRLARDQHVLLVNLHHIVADALSLEVLIREVSAVYQAELRGTKARLPALSVQYSDYAAWQRNRPDLLTKQLKWWRQQLAGAPALLELPYDRPRPGRQSHRGAVVSFQITQSGPLKSRADEYGATLAMTLQAAFAILISRLSGSTDLLFGNPVANRNYEELEPLIGLFINTLVLRLDTRDDPSFNQLLAKVRQATLDAHHHGDVPFDQLVDSLEVKRDLGNSPVFQISFVFVEEVDATQVSLPGLITTPVEKKAVTSKFDLTLSLSHGPTGLWGSFEYNTDLFDHTTIGRWASHFCTLIGGITTSPQTPMSQLPLLGETARSQLLEEANRTAADYPRDRLLHQLFEAQVQRTPNAVAIVSTHEKAVLERELTYAELNRRADVLATYLSRRGVRAETVVGLCLPRSSNTVISLLAILKAGACYLPLDPSFPEDRLAFMLEDARVPVLLTTQELEALFKDFNGEVVFIDRPVRIAKSAPVPKLPTTNAAYIIYTSGSTGRPKGAVISHGAICNHMFWFLETWPHRCGDAVLQKTPLSFDASVWEFYAPLLSGGRLVLAPPNGHRDPVHLLEMVRNYRITTLQVVPSLLQLLLETGDINKCRNLQHLFCGGEALSPALRDNFLSNSKAAMHNVYGPTEACIHASAHTCSTEPAHTVPIGKPIKNGTVYLLDGQLQPVPIGITGELYVGGAGLGRGYLNRPGLTADRYIPNPFAEAGERLYRSGDLARYLASWEIEYLGREDGQIKLRGFRIEIGEIENQLNSFPSMIQAAITLNQDDNGNRRLVAWLVAKDQKLELEALKNHLNQNLPDYMLPSAYQFLSELPQTPSGKLDRAALSHTPLDMPQNKTGHFVAPRNDEEAILTHLMAETLGHQRIGIHDNFFEMGGDSILSIQFIFRCNREGFSLKPGHLFQHQTVADLVRMSRTKNSYNLPNPEQGPALLTPIQRHFFDQQRPEPHHFNQSVFLTVPADLDLVLLDRAARTLVAHHKVLSYRYYRLENRWVQKLVNPPDLPLLETYSHKDAASPMWLTDTTAMLQASLDLAEGPLLRLAHFDLGPTVPGRLLWVIHHILVDGISWRILLQDLLSVYGALVEGQEIDLPPHTTSFSGWSRRLQDYAASQSATRELAFWLNPARAMVEPLPRDLNEPTQPATMAQTGQVRIEFDERVTSALLEETPARLKAQINDLLLSALSASFTAWTGSSKLLLDLEGHGREEIFEDVDLTRTVGWFTSLFPVLLPGDAKGTAHELLMPVKQALSAIPNRGIGYGLLRYLSPDESIRDRLAALPRPQVSFNYLGRLDRGMDKESPFAPAPENCGPAYGPGEPLTYAFEINGAVSAGRLHLTWTYDATAYRPETVTNLVDKFRDQLVSLTSPPIHKTAPAFVASSMSGKGLENLFSKINQRKSQ